MIIDDGHVKRKCFLFLLNEIILDSIRSLDKANCVITYFD